MRIVVYIVAFAAICVLSMAFAIAIADADFPETFGLGGIGAP